MQRCFNKCIFEFKHSGGIYLPALCESLHTKIYPDYFMRITVLLTIAFIVSFLSPAHSQKKRNQEWYQLLDNPNAIFYDIKDAFSKYEKQNAKMLREKFRKGKNAKQEEEETPGFEIYKRWEYFMEPRVYPSGNISLPRRTKLDFEN